MFCKICILSYDKGSIPNLPVVYSIHYITHFNKYITIVLALYYQIYYNCQWNLGFSVTKCSVVIYRLGGSVDLGLNKLKFSRSPFWMLLHWIDPP